MKVSIRSNRAVLAGIFAVVLLGFSITTAMACRSYVEKIEDAEDFCRKKLECEPPLVVVCRGQTREWKCRCEKPKAEAEAVKEFKKETEQDYSINKDVDKASPKLLEDK